MGIYLNPGKAAYEQAVRSEIYIDKTEMIHYLNSVVMTNQKYVSVSQPPPLRNNNGCRHALRIL